MDNPLESTGVVIRRDGEPRPGFVGHLGSCFAFGSSEWFLTARHVVSGMSPDELGVALYLEHEIDGDIGWNVADVYEHEHADVALIHVPDWGLEVFDPFIGISPDIELGDPVRCFGYPTQAIPENRPVVPRMIRGYVQRRFIYRSPLGSEYPALELSFAAPAGLSGAPISLDNDRSRAIGVVCENFESSALRHQVSEVERDGEVVREQIHSVVTFAIAAALWSVAEWVSEITGWGEA